MNKKEIKLLSDLKYNAFLLKNKSQIPNLLFDYIVTLDKNSDIEFVKCLSNLAEHLIRVPGYYKKYPDSNKQACEFIRDKVKTYLK